MKPAKRLLVALLAALLTLSLAGCGNENGLDIPANQTSSRDFQKNMHQSKYLSITDMCETDTGVYFNYNGYLYYLSKKDKRATILCAKPDCQHKGKDCNAWINSWGMWSKRWDGAPGRAGAFLQSRWFAVLL